MMALGRVIYTKLKVGRLADYLADYQPIDWVD